MSRVSMLLLIGMSAFIACGVFNTARFAPDFALDPTEPPDIAILPVSFTTGRHTTKTIEAVPELDALIATEIAISCQKILSGNSFDVDVLEAEEIRAADNPELLLEQVNRVFEECTPIARKAEGQPARTVDVGFLSDTSEIEHTMGPRLLLIVAGSGNFTSGGQKAWNLFAGSSTDGLRLDGILVDPQHDRVLWMDHATLQEDPRFTENIFSVTRMMLNELSSNRVGQDPSRPSRVDEMDQEAP